VEDAAAAALMQLTFPVQILVTSQAVDVKAAVDELKNTHLPPALADLARQRASYLEALAQERAASARQAYLVVSCDTAKGFEHARGELTARVVLLADALGAAKMRLEVLTSDAVVDLLSHLLNRGRPWRPSDAVEAGVLASYHISERSAAHAHT
jgi:acyl-CoA reductase-like NAD-dependent aldehyde dehydrogenase